MFRLISINRVLILTIALPTTFIFSVLVHEFGHVLGAKIVGVDSVEVYVWPGYEVVPNFGKPYSAYWPKGEIAFVTISAKSNALKASSEKPFTQRLFEELSTIQSLNTVLSKTTINSKEYKNNKIELSKLQTGTIGIMGSALNLIISLISIALIYMFKPKGAWLVVGVCGAILYYDILFYTVFPIFFNLKHIIFWGGDVAEPIISLSKLGIAQYISIPVIILLAFMQSLFLYKLFFKHN